MVTLENIGFYNVLSILIGLSMIITCCLIAYFFQKHLFSKYKNQVKNTVKVARRFEKGGAK